MKTLAKQISELLFEHDCVIVPGLGGFITIYKPAFISPHHNTFYPPSKQVTFNAVLAQNDGVLFSAYAKSQGLEFKQAKIIIEEKIQNIRISLLKGRSIELDEIGTLTSNKENNIEFHPVNSLNYLGDAYGLTKFSFNPVDRSNATTRVLTRPAVRKTMRWAAVLLPIAAVAMWTTFNVGSLNNLYSNYASLIPSAKEEVSNSRSKDISSTNTSTAFSDQDVANEYTADTKCISPSISESTSYTFSQPEALSTTGTAKTISVELSHRAIKPAVQEQVITGDVQYYIIAGAFGVEENASKLITQLKSEGYNAELLGQNRRKLYLVSIKSFSNKESAIAELQNVHHKGYSSAWLLEKAN